MGSDHDILAKNAGFFAVVRDLLPKCAGFFALRRVEALNRPVKRPFPGSRPPSDRRRTTPPDRSRAAHSDALRLLLSGSWVAPAVPITPSHLDLHRVDI